MEWLILFNLIISVVVMGKVFLGPRKAQEAISAPHEHLPLASGHSLVRVWDNRSCERERQGWWFECTCGMKRASDYTNDKSFGTESKAIESFKKHAQLHSTVGPHSNEQQQRYDRLKDQFDRYREKCYCKGTNDDLILIEREL